MRVNGNERQNDWLVTLICGLGLIAAGTAACLLRGFFFTGEMYLFLTVWFGLCGVLLGLVVIYMAAGRGAQVEEQPERRKHIRELAGSIGGGRGWLSGVTQRLCATLSLVCYPCTGQSRIRARNAE